MIVAGGVTSPRDLAARLHDQGIDAEPAQLRADLRALGAIRVVGPDGEVLAVPADPGSPKQPTSAPGPTLAQEVVADPDWKLQAAVVSVVALLVLVGLLGWLLGL